MADSTAASTADSHGGHSHGGHSGGGHPADPSKRDMLELMAGAGAAIFGAAIVWPLVVSMNPAADVLAHPWVASGGINARSGTAAP